MLSNKNKRIDDEKSLKVLKWNFDVPRKEFVEQLKTQFEPCVNRTLLMQLFHDDFKHHINALQTLLKVGIYLKIYVFIKPIIRTLKRELLIKWCAWSNKPVSISFHF